MRSGVKQRWVCVKLYAPCRVQVSSRGFISKVRSVDFNVMVMDRIWFAFYEELRGCLMESGWKPTATWAE